jgi:hypothetical protein
MMVVLSMQELLHRGLINSKKITIIDGRGFKMDKGIVVGG